MTRLTVSIARYFFGGTFYFQEEKKTFLTKKKLFLQKSQQFVKETAERCALYWCFHASFVRALIKYTIFYLKMEIFRAIISEFSEKNLI